MAKYHFKTIKEREAFIETILKKDITTKISKSDQCILKYFYDQYYQPKKGEEKINSNEINDIKIVINKNIYYTKCLEFHFGGMKTRIIRKKFLVGSAKETPKMSITNLMRKDIKSQIEGFKLITKKPNNYDEFEVDHYPISFYKLRDNFIQKYLSKSLQDFFSSVESYDEKVSEQWKKYHQDCVDNGGLKWSTKEENRNRMPIENKMRDDIEYQIRDFETKTPKPNKYENFQAVHKIQLCELINKFIENCLGKSCSEFFSNKNSYKDEVSIKWKEYHQNYINDGGLEWVKNDKNLKRKLST